MALLLPIMRHTSPLLPLSFSSSFIIQGKPLLPFSFLCSGCGFGFWFGWGEGWFQNKLLECWFWNKFSWTSILEWSFHKQKCCFENIFAYENSLFGNAFCIFQNFRSRSKTIFYYYGTPIMEAIFNYCETSILKMIFYYYGTHIPEVIFLLL